MIRSTKNGLRELVGVADVELLLSGAVGVEGTDVSFLRLFALPPYVLNRLRLGAVEDMINKDSERALEG